jgi:nicotinamidase-related amidase
MWHTKLMTYKNMTKDNTALLIVDVVNSCAHEKCEIPEWKVTFEKVRQMVPKLATFISDFRQTFTGPVIFGRTRPWQKEYLAHNINELYEDDKYAYYTPDRSGFAEEFYVIKPQPGDIITDKDTNDALTDPHLLAQLQEQKIRYIAVTGAFTDGCVLATVIGGFTKGYSMVVLKDLVETTDSSQRQRIQEDLLTYTFPYMFARVISSDELLHMEA